jgi:hypothetical protein
VARRISHQLCSRGADHQYARLLQTYRGNGFYVPELTDGSPDLDTIRDGLSDVKSKLKWLDGLVEDLKNSHDFPNEEDATLGILRLVDESLDLKKRMRLATNQKEARDARRASINKLTELRAAWESLIQRIPFLLSYDFPVDHLKAREQFERAKTSAGTPAKRKRKCNTLFFARRLREDGAFDPETRGGYDMYLRTTLDTLTLRLRQDEESLPDDVRYDLEWAVEALRSTLSSGRLVQIARLKAWRDKVAGSLDFYQSVLTEKPEALPPEIRERGKHVKNLRDFVLKKHAEAYRLLAKEPEMIQALWVMTKILFNEVGASDRQFGLEKRDIAQIVINRRKHPRYSRLPVSDDLYPYVSSTLKGGRADKPWLNVLFREGEFSFTYYYIPSVVDVFCSDRSRRGQEIQREDSRIALELLRHPNPDFQALRYFSRRSMTGKIDMSTSWPEYVPIPERAGRTVRQVVPLRRALHEGDYRYLYDFVDPAGTRYDVVQVDGETYAVAGFPAAPEFHHYRDPHAFKYFRRFRDAPARETAGSTDPDADEPP